MGEKMKLPSPLDLSGQTSNDDNDDHVTRLLKKLYYTPGLPSSFSSPNTLYHEAKKVNSEVTLRDIRSFLNDQNVHLAFKRKKSIFPRRKIERGVAPDFCWEVDLFFLLKFKKFNSNYQVSVCVCVLKCCSAVVL